MRTRTQQTRPIFSYVVAGIFAGATGTYLFEHDFHLAMVALLGVTGVLADLAITAQLKRDKLGRARCKRARNNTAQSRMRWDYRPKNGIQRREQDQETEAADALSLPASGTDTDNASWFDFVAIDQAVADAGTTS